MVEWYVKIIQDQVLGFWIVFMPQKSGCFLEDLVWIKSVLRSLLRKSNSPMSSTRFPDSLTYGLEE